ncbi:MAG TPA: glycine betaine ABC transporter substrate-binding protein [Gemmatimonadaceae bacterium]|nr:glycine betaine ABC transporter substrate-binding protein [Gemmatimonadaceae bacterium]
MKLLRAALALGIVCGSAGGLAAQSARPIVVASKPFGESYVLAEMFAQLLEARGLTVERRRGLGATEIAFRALRTGAIDVYPEYTGTGLLAVLGEPSRPGQSAGAVFDYVGREFLRRYDVRWLPPLGFENTYAIAVRRATADSLSLRTLSDLARVSSRLRAGFTPDFIGRPDGLPGLTSAYGIRPRDVRSLLPAVKYQALAEGAVDVVDGYSTDGLIRRYNLVVLQDDKAFFPPYEAAALARNAAIRDDPRVAAVLTELSGRLDVERMRALNERVEVAGETIESVARSALSDLGLINVSARGDTAARPARAGSLFDYMSERRAQIGRMALRHLILVALSLLLAIVFAVPLGLALERLPRQAEGVIRGVGLLQTIPSIALLAFMLPALGIGIVPALVALFLYSLYPIVRNTYSGVRNADPAAVAAATALGMTERQVLRHVRLPLAAPVIMAGIRTAGVIAVGTATLAAFIGAGGLGDPIVAGLALSDTRMILSGALPAALLALIVDGVLALAERAATPAR